jgi:hypothetical protein
MIPQTSKNSFATTTNTVSETAVPTNTQPTTKPEVSSASANESQQPTANPAGPATEQKGYLEMGQDLMRNSLNRAYELKNSVHDYFYGSNSAAPKPVDPQECEQPAPTINELAKVETKNMTEAQKFDHYKQIAELGGGTMNLEPGARNIVGIRTPTPIDAGKIDPKTLNSKGVYDDTLAVLWTDKDGTKRVEEFRNQATVDPARKFTETSSQDVDHNGYKDGGRLVPGFYKYEVSTREVGEGEKKRTEPALRPVNDVTVERDLDGDGLYNDNYTDTKSGKTILIHTGYNSETGSAGCQTITKSEWNRFIQSFPDDMANKNDIGYTLVQVDQ